MEKKFGGNVVSVVTNGKRLFVQELTDQVVRYACQKKVAKQEIRIY